MLVIFLVFAQAALATELTPEELLTMPTVSITYTLQDGGETLVLDATPTLSPQGKAYWVMLPAEAFSFPMTLTITASETAPYTFIPMTGDTLVTDINTVDYEGLSTLITAYQNDVMVDTYRLYVSPAEMPLVVTPAEVPVYYVDAENNATVLHYEVVLAYYDQVNTYTADTSLVPANYTLVGNSSATVTVNELGQATPEWVTFYFQAQAVQGTLQVYYTDPFGTEIAASQTLTLDPGTHTVTPNPSDLPSGYVLSPESPAQVDVTVDDQGVVTPEVVTFTYEQQAVTGFLTVNYADESGVPLVAAEMLELSSGTHSVTPNPAYVPSGYTLAGTSQPSFSVDVDTSGNVNPSSVTFYFAPEEVTPVTGYLPVYYTDLNGTQIISPETLELAQGQHTITPNAAIVPSGYVLSASHPAQVDVTVGASGDVSPASVTFFYEEQQAAAGTLTIEYRDESNALIGTPQTATLSVGTHEISIDTSTIPAGYALSAASPTQFTVTVDEQGIVSPSTIAFILTVTQTQTPALTAVESYAVTNTAAVNFRSSPDSSSSANIAFPEVAQGTQVWVYGTFTQGDREWASIRYNDTDCYVWNSLITLVEATPSPTATTAATETPGPTPTLGEPADLSGTYPDYAQIGAFAVTNATGVRFRSTPDTSTDANILYQVNQGTEVWVHGMFTTGDTQWAYIRYENTDCYVRFSLLTLSSTYATPTPTVTASPTATETLGPTPTLGTPTDISATYPDYTEIGATGVTNDTGVRFRSTPDTSGSENIQFQVTQGTEVWVHGMFTVGDQQWAYIRYANTDSYVWLSLLNVTLPTPTNSPAVSPTESAAPTSSPTASPTESAAPTSSPTESVEPTSSPTSSPLVTPTGTPADMPAPDDQPEDISATYPDFAVIGKPALTNDTGVRFRSAPDSASTTNILTQVVHGHAGLGAR